MLKSRRRVAIGITAVASAVSMLALAVPAQAVVPATPAWPTAGRAPAGCDASVAIGGTVTAWNYSFTDASQPVVTDARVSGNATNVTVLAPAGGPLNMYLKGTENCSGIGLLGGYFARNRVILTGAPFVNTTADAFSSWWSYNIPNIKPDDGVGVWTLPYAIVERRYDSFVLDQDFKLTGTPVASSTSIGTTGAWATKPSYVLRATTLTNTLSTYKTTKGKTVKATAQLKMATNAGYVADASAKVLVQTKVGTGAWTTNATLTTSASGIVTYSFVLSATTQVRFIHKTVLSGKFTSGKSSIIRTVTKI